MPHGFMGLTPVWRVWLFPKVVGRVSAEVERSAARELSGTDPGDTSAGSSVAATSQEFERELRSALWTADWIIRRLLAGESVRNVDESLAEIRRLAEAVDPDA